jgi:hypothetical protein
LCGANLQAVAEPPLASEDPAGTGPPISARPETLGAADSEMPSASATGGEGAFCNQCGWKNPVGARFCSACGAQLQAVNAPSTGARPVVPVRPVAADEVLAGDASKEPAATGSAVTPRALLLVLAGLLVVATLYLVTFVSKQAARPSPQAAEAAVSASDSDLPPTEALPPTVAARVSTLEQEAAGLSGEAQVEKRREVVNLLIGIGRPDRAAVAQESIAEAVGTGEEWYRAGNLFYDWMDQLEEGRKFQVAPRAAAAYEKGLEIGPEDLNVRTTLAMTYLYTSNPMRGVTTIRSVLDTEPTHLQANFYYGVMLMQINRIDQAIEQFEAVQGLVPEDHPMHRQAEALVKELQAFQAGS